MLNFNGLQLHLLVGTVDSYIMDCG